jgi:hypothetical protein
MAKQAADGRPQDVENAQRMRAWRMHRIEAHPIVDRGLD